MDWNLLPILTATAIGCVGFCLMLSAFVIARLNLNQPMQAVRFNLARRLMIVGAGLSILFFAITCALFLMSGGIPWIK